MNSGMIGKIDKAHRYAEEPDRMQIGSFQATFRGSHDSYDVSYNEHGWHCSCHTFEAHVLDSCPHVMAAQILLSPMLSEEARYGKSLEAIAESVQVSDSKGNCSNLATFITNTTAPPIVTS